MSARAMSTPDDTPRHRIGAVARLTGISTHALRVWERRYGAFQPQRTEGGDRLYSDGDIQRLRMIKRLLGLGHGIGDVAKLPVAELDHLLSMHVEVRAESAPGGQLVERYLEHIERLDTTGAEQMLANAAMALPRRELIDQVLVPLLHEVGRRWQAGTLHVSQEHAASAMVRSQLGAMLRLFAPDPGAPRALATTLEGELHELGALMAAVVAAMCGWHTLYLGPNLPATEIAHAAKSSGADAVLASSVCLEPEQARARLAELDLALGSAVSLVVGGASAQEIAALPRAVVRVADLAELEAWLATHRKAAGRRAGRVR